MYKLLLTAIILAITLSSCTKEQTKTPEQPKINKIEMKPGEGALFVGSIRHGEVAEVKIAKAENPNTFIKTLLPVVGKTGNKSLSNCNVPPGSRGSLEKLPAGDYILEIIIMEGNQKPNHINITIEDGKCLSVEVRGVAW